MRSRLLTLVVLALVAWLLYRTGVESDLATAPPPSGGVLFPGLEIQDVDYVSLKFRTQHVLDVEREPQGPWLITHPTDEVAQEEYVDALVRNLANAKVLPVEEQGGDLDPEQVGLGRRAKSITFGRDGALVTLHVGDRNPFGPGVFARLEGSPHVLLVTENLDTMLESFRAEDYVDKHLWRGLKGDIRGVRVVGPDGVRLDARKDGGRWSLVAPVAALADDGRIATLVRSMHFSEQIYPIATERVDSQLHDARLPNAADVAAGELNGATLVELYADGQEPSRVYLQAGWDTQPDPEILVARGDLRKILVVDRREFNVLQNGADFYRERRLFPPIRDRARRVRIERGDEVLLDVSVDDRGTWTYRAPERLAGVALDSERVDGFSLVSEFLGDVDALRVASFTDAPPEGDAAATLRVDWDWAGRERTDVVSLHDLDGDAGVRARSSGRPDEGLVLGEEVLALLDPGLADRLRNVTPLAVPEERWGGFEIHMPGLDAPLTVSRPGPGTPWQGDDAWGRRFGLGHDLLAGFRGLRWRPALEGAEHPWRLVFLGFDGAPLGSVALRGVTADEPQEVLGTPAAVARLDAVPGMELYVPAALLDRIAVLRDAQRRGDDDS